MIGLLKKLARGLTIAISDKNAVNEEDFLAKG